MTVQLRIHPPRHRLTWCWLARPKMLRRILRTVAEFGVGHLHLVQTAGWTRATGRAPCWLTPGG